MKPDLHLLSLPTLQQHFSSRDRAAHKGDFGHVLIIGGDHGMAGAVGLAARAAARVGAGLVTVATRAEHVSAITVLCPEALCYGIAREQELHALIARATVIVIGPGLGQSAWSKGMLKAAQVSKRPLVVDADALNLLAQGRAIAHTQWILTPHPGEAARLLQCDTGQIQADRPAAVQALQAKWGGVCILKGAGTLIADDSATIYQCTAGNPGMASGGMGDVLSGILGGFIAQGFSLTLAAQLGVVIHAHAADQAARDGERGLLASDLIARLRNDINP